MAERYDTHAEALIVGQAGVQEIKRELDNLNNSNPILGQEVTAHGTSLTVSIDEDMKTYPLALPVEPERYACREMVDHQGEYLGLGLVLAYDCRKNETIYRIAHRIGCFTVAYDDETKDVHAAKHTEYMLAQDCRIIPTQPMNAHSMRDLANDRVISWFDAVVQGFGNDRDRAVRTLGRFVDIAMARCDGREGLAHQQISYLNAKYLLRGAVLVVAPNKIVAGDKGSLARGDVSIHHESTNPIAVHPLMFEMAHAWTLDGRTGAVIPRDRMELNVITHITKSRAALVPVKNILRVEDSGRISL